MPSLTLLRTGLRDLARRPLHTALLVLGVALGVAVVVAIDLANESARRAFTRSTEAVVGRATHEVLGGPGGVPVALYERLRSEWGLRRSAPVVEAVGVADSLGRQAVRLLGVDPLCESAFRDHLGGATLVQPGFERLFTEDGVVLGAPLARRHGLGLGDRLSVRVEGRRLQLVVLGLVEPAAGDSGAALDGLLLLDVGVAQRLLGRDGRLSRIDLILEPAEAAALAERLPPGVRLVPASEQAASAAQLTEAFQLNLTALSLLALVVGMFLIYNTVMFSVVQRRAVFGTLRTLGVTGGQLLGLILVEASLASALGTLVGIGFGWLLGQGAVRLVTRTINDLYFVLAVSGAPLVAVTVAKAVLVGVGAGVVSALPPALEAARVEPAIALRPASFETRSRGLVPWLALVGVVLAAAGGAALALVPDRLWVSFAGLFAIVVGCALVAPLATLALMAVAAPVGGALVGTLGRLAPRTVARSIGRTGVAVASLMVAVSVTIGVSLMIGSFRATVRDWLELSLVADVYVSAPAPGARTTPTLPAEVPARVAAVTGVAHVESFRRVRVASDVGEVALGATDSVRGRSEGLYRFAEGSAAEAWRRVRAGAVVVSEPFAHRHRLPLRGGRLTLRTDRGDVDFPVAGVFYDYSTEEGTVLMSRGVYDRYFDDRGVSSLAVWVAPGEAAERVAERLRQALVGSALQVTPTGSLKQQALRVFDRTFAVTHALRLLAVIVAFIGVWSALMALQVERTRELATLRALGLLPGQLWGLSLIETGLMGLAAGVLSLPLGGLLAAILVEVINVRSFGWTMRLELDPALFAQALAVSVGASLLAAVYPLVRLQRRAIAAALRQE